MRFQWYKTGKLYLSITPINRRTLEQWTDVAKNLAFLAHAIGINNLYFIKRTTTLNSNLRYNATPRWVKLIVRFNDWSSVQFNNSLSNRPTRVIENISQLLMSRITTSFSLYKTIKLENGVSREAESTLSAIERRTMSFPALSQRPWTFFPQMWLICRVYWQRKSLKHFDHGGLSFNIYLPYISSES